MNNKILQAALAFALLTTIHLASQACTLPVEAVINNDDPTWKQVNQTLCFDGSDSRPIGGIFQWKWDFGDGDSTPVTGGSPPDCTYLPKVEHSYSTVNEYDPELWVKGVYGDEDSKSFKLYVIDIDLTADSTYLCHDLVPIHLSIDTTKSDDIGRLIVSSGEPYIRIWKNPDKTDLLIPHNGKCWRDWSASYFSPTKTWYAEGIPACSNRYPLLLFQYIGVYPNQTERIVGPSPYVHFTVCPCECIPQNEHCGATQYISDLTGAYGEIKTRWGQLCCEPCSSGASAFSAAIIGAATDAVEGGPGWGEAGYIRIRSGGPPNDFVFSEVTWPGHHLEFFPQLAPSEGSTHSYTAMLDNTSGCWEFYFDGIIFDICCDWPEPWTWVGKTLEWAYWSGEVENKQQDDMPGTTSDRCEFTDCEYRDDMGDWHSVSLSPEDLDPGDPVEFGIEYVNPTAFNIWDKHPN